MPYRQYLDVVERLRQRLEQLQREGCPPRAASAALAEAIAQFDACAQELSQAGEDCGGLRKGPDRREQQFRSVFEHNLDAAFFLDARGCFTEVNPAGERLSGYCRAELLQMDFSRLLVPEALPTVVSEFQQALQGQARHVETTFLRKDGQRLQVHVTGGPLVVDGQPVGVFGIARDITRHKQDEAHIRQLNEQLERRVAERTARLEAANRQLQAEIAERRRVEAQLQQRGGLQRLIAELATNFIQRKTEQIDEGINRTLEQVGRFAGVDRSYLCVYSDDRTSLTVTHEWCAPGIPPNRQNVQAAPVTNRPWITPQLLAGQVVHIPRVADLPPGAATERKAFEGWATRSFLAVPLVLAGQVVGVIGFDSVREEKRWPADIIDLLQIAGEMLVNALQRQRTERALRRSEARYRALVEQMPGLVYVVSMDDLHQLQYAGPQVETILGYSLAECLAEKSFWLHRVHPEDRQKAMAGLGPDSRAGRPFTREYRLIARDGRVVWVRDDAVVIPDAAGGPPLLQGVASDITDRVRAEQALRDSEQKYRQIVENTQEVIMLTGRDGIITYMSPAARRVLGYEPEDLVGRQPWISHPDDLERVRRMHAEALQGRSGTNFEYRVITKGGQVKWVSHSWSTLAEGPQGLIISVVRDITERKIAQQQIERHEAQLRALASELVLAEERERRQLAGDLHDDIGQLLALAQIRLGVLDRSTAGTTLAEPLAQLRQLIEQAMRSTRSLTFQLCPPALYDLGFVPAAEWLAEDVQQRYDLQVELADDGQDKPLDERLGIVLFRSLREVLINAAKHARVETVRVGIRRCGERLQVEVTDAGAGFDPAAVRARSPQGFGLFSIEERLGYLGGRITIRSKPGEGTTIVLEAPLKTPSRGDKEAGT